MKHWSEKLATIESTFGRHEQRSWMPAVETAQQVWAAYPESATAKVRVLYLLHHILVEEDYPAEEHDRMASLLKRYFWASYEQFAEHAEYLFFVGKILYVAEWYFGLDDDAKPPADKLAFNMQKRAAQNEPDNPLYEWAVAFSKDDKERSFDLAKLLLGPDSEGRAWLEARGFPGQYVLASLAYCYEQYKQRA